jgi:hypothetical protein
MATPEAYADLNPFISTSIGETDLWQNGIWADVPSIHATQYDALAKAVAATRTHKRTQVRFVRGAGGSGKSHLFTRLRRQMADSIFYAYAANPPRQPEALEPFLLNRLIGSLRHPARAKDGSVMPYSQLRHLAYALLKPVVEQDITLSELHDAWMKIPLPEQKDLIHQALILLEEEHPLVPRSVLRAVLSTLRGDKEHLSAQWLSGATYLSENDLKYLSVPEPLKREDAGTVMQLLGRLAAQAGLPFVLVLDQLDLFTKPEELDEFQRLLFTLIDQSTNWVVFIGLISDRFVTWDAAMTQALRGRIGVPDPKAPLGFRLAVIDVLPVGNGDKRALLEKRLASPELVAQRKEDGIQSAIHPLTTSDLEELLEGGAIFPRHLLAAAAERYEDRVAGKLEGTATPAKKPEPPPVPKAATPKPATAPPIPATKPTPKPSVTPPPMPVPVPAVPVAKAASPAPRTNPLAAAATKPAPAPTGDKTPLKAKMTELLAKAIGNAKSSGNTPSPVELGERVRDLIELMARTTVIVRPGNLKESYTAFDGVDQIYTWGGSTLRIVATDAVRNSFIAALERLHALDGPLLLLRHDVAPVSGVRTIELVNDIKRRHHFHHIPSTESDTLNALGSVLASLREGSYESLATEPAATTENVRRTLKDLPVIQNHHLWEVILKAHGSKSGTVAPAPAAKPPAPAEAVKPKSTLAAIAEQTARVASKGKSSLPPPNFVAIAADDGKDDSPAIPVAKVATAAKPPPVPSRFPAAPGAKPAGKAPATKLKAPPIPAHRAAAPPVPGRPKPASKK